MATYELVTTADQDRVIAYRLEVVNAERAAQVPPLDPLDVSGLMNQYLDSQVALYSEAALEDRRGRLIEAFEAAPDEDQAAVKTTLGLP